LEFLARVTFANLRWTVEQLQVRGEDSDRGTIYIRYGPPPTVAGFAPPLESRPHCSAISGQLLCEAVSSTPAGNGYVLWYYPEINLHFVFQAPPTYGTASLASQYLEVAEEMRQKAPASWTNLQIARSHLESPIPVQLTRFRSNFDSVEIFVAAAIPVEQLRRGAADGANIAVGLSLFDAAGNTLFTDTASIANDTAALQVRAWRKRLARRPEALYRLDALQKSSLRTAKALGKLRLDLGSGFGLSDLLVATSLAPRESAVRWSDMLIVPGTGLFSVGDPIALLWETYGLGDSEASSAYRVAVSVRRIEEHGAVAVATRILSGIREAVVKGNGNPSPILKYARRVPSTGRSLDFLTIGSEGLPAGSYEVQVEVTDSTTGKTATAHAPIQLIRRR
jgi:GWxTD domain-containing protein